MPDSAVFRFLADQVVGVLAFLVILWIYVREKESERKWRDDIIAKLREEKKESEERYAGVARERRITSEGVLTMLGKVEVHLSRADAFEEFAKRAVKESINKELPKRRAMDTLLSEGILKLTED